MATISKTLRLSPETIEQIESWPGDTFTQKFSNLVDDTYRRRAFLEREIKELEARRVYLANDISDMRSIKDSLIRARTISNRSLDLLKSCEQICYEIAACSKRIAKGCEPDA